ncbi:MAG: ATP-binding protein [Microvirga sp.]
MRAHPCASLPALIEELNAGAAFVIVTEENLITADLSPMVAWLDQQENWSDLPFVLLTAGGGGLERNPAARRFLDILGNVTFLERPFHPTTLVSIARAALRARRRQYEARARLEALRDSEERYRALFENIDEGFCIIEFIDGPDGPLSDYIHVEANPAYALHAGIPNVVGQKVRTMVPDEADAWVALYRGVLATGESIRFEKELVATGRHLELAAFRAGDPERPQVAVVFQDITSRKRAELALRELNDTLERRIAEAVAEQRLIASIVEGTDAFVQVVDLEYRWLAINQAATKEFERIFGKRPQRGQSMLDLLADQPEHQRDVKAVWSRALAGEEYTEVATFGDPKRDRRFYEMKFNVLRDADGVQIGAYQFVYDVTERLAEQQRLIQAEEALRHSQKMEAVGQLTGGVAHDFNNLLTIIKSSTDLLRRPNVTEERRGRYVEAISDTVDRASKLTGQLLAFARRQALKPEVFDASQRVESITDMLRTVIGSRIELTTDFDCEDCHVEVDASQFETSLINMVVNARDAMDGQGSLTIRIAAVKSIPPIRDQGRTRGAFVALSITDTGSGISEDKLEQIFEPFYTTKGVGKGTGLGLSQVYGFAKQSGGDVAVESEVGRGTTFTLYLPRAEAKAAVNNGFDTKDNRSTSDGHGSRLLVVEDNVEVGKFSTQLLQDLGYATTWAANAEQALELLSEKGDFDAVFSDVVMPGMSGVELGREIRRRYPTLPVVLTSGYSDVLAQEGRHGFELLQKPYAVEDLSRVLRRVTQGSRPQPPQKT